jgi:hypothetical protein
MIVGFIVAFFTLVQARRSIVRTYAQWLLQLGALTIASAVVYSTFRVVLYGSLSGVLTHGGLEAYRTFVTGHGELFEHAQVDGFAWSQLEKRTIVRSKLYKLRGGESPWAKRDVKFWVQPPMVFSVLVAMLIVGVMFGWSVEIFFWVIYALTWAVVLLVLVSLRFAASLQRIMLP